MSVHGPIRRVRSRRSAAGLTSLLLTCLPLTAGVAQEPQAEGVREIPSEPLARRFFLKLPLENIQHHWRFRSREDFLAGSLTLRVIREGQVHSLPVFSRGLISDGWRIMAGEDEEGEVYFGFSSEERHLSAPDDSLELELVVVKDLPGWGARLQGDLLEGTYLSTGSYSGLTDHSTMIWVAAMAMGEGLSIPEMEEMPEFRALRERLKEHVGRNEFMAGLECWRQKWPLRITAEEGWLGPERARVSREMQDVSGLLRSARPDMGTDGRRCDPVVPDTLPASWERPWPGERRPPTTD